MPKPTVKKFKKPIAIITGIAFKKVAGHEYSDNCGCSDCNSLWGAVLFGDAKFFPKR